MAGCGWNVPEISPGLSERVQAAFRIAKLKDVGSEVSYEAWWNEGMYNGPRATEEFVKAINPQPDKNARKDGMTIQKLLEEHTSESQKLWDWYWQKKIATMPSVPESEKSSEASSPSPGEPA